MTPRAPRPTLFPYTTLFRSLGEMARQARDWRRAIEHFLRSVKLDPEFMEAQIGLGKALVSAGRAEEADRKSTRLNSSHANNSYAVFCLKKKNIAVDRHVKRG